jgi:hypothetical protein
VASSRTPTPSVDPAHQPARRHTGPPERVVDAARSAAHGRILFVDPEDAPTPYVQPPAKRMTRQRVQNRRPPDVRTPASIRGMWQRPAMRHALADRDLSEVCRIMQRHGISQRAIAAATGLAQSDVSDFIAGKRHVSSYAVLERFALGLGLPRGWMGLAYDDDTVALFGDVGTERR